MIADHCTVLVHPVVIDEHTGCPDIGVLADLRVADVGQVRHLGPGTDPGVLGLHEPADLARLPQHGAGPQVGERPHGGPRTDHRVLGLGPDDGRPVAHLGVGQGRVRSDDRVLPEHPRQRRRRRAFVLRRGGPGGGALPGQLTLFRQSVPDLRLRLRPRAW